MFYTDSPFVPYSDALTSYRVDKLELRSIRHRALGILDGGFHLLDINLYPQPQSNP